MKLLPLGTVIRVNEHNVCIIGYGSGKNEKITASGYLVVSYPLGFTNAEKIFFIPHDYDFTIISEGYKTELSKASESPPFWNLTISSVRSDRASLLPWTGCRRS